MCCYISVLLHNASFDTEMKRMYPLKLNISSMWFYSRLLCFMITSMIQKNPAAFRGHQSSVQLPPCPPVLSPPEASCQPWHQCCTSHNGPHIHKGQSSDVTVGLFSQDLITNKRNSPEWGNYQVLILPLQITQCSDCVTAAQTTWLLCRS